MKKINLLKLSLSFCLIWVLVMALLITACSKTTPSPSPAPPATSSEKPIELKIAHFAIPTSSFHEGIFVPWAKKVEELSKGRVKITLYPAEALGKAPDHYNMLTAGTADIAWVDTSFSPSIFPLSEGILLPFLFRSAEASAASYYEVTAKYLMNTEYKNVSIDKIFG